MFRTVLNCCFGNSQFQFFELSRNVISRIKLSHFNFFLILLCSSYGEKLESGKWEWSAKEKRRSCSWCKILQQRNFFEDYKALQAYSYSSLDRGPEIGTIANGMWRVGSSSSTCNKKILYSEDVQQQLEANRIMKLGWYYCWRTKTNDGTRSNANATIQYANSVMCTVLTGKVPPSIPMSQPDYEDRNEE
jgi:hypothetical protein